MALKKMLAAKKGVDLAKGQRSKRGAARGKKVTLAKKKR